MQSLKFGWCQPELSKHNGANIWHFCSFWQDAICIECTAVNGICLLQSANNLAQSQKSGKADDKKKNVEYASHAWKQIVAKYQVCTILRSLLFLSFSVFCFSSVLHIFTENSLHCVKIEK